MPRKRTNDDIRRELTDDDGRLKRAPERDGLVPEWFDDSDEPANSDTPIGEESDAVYLTANQLVAYNLQRARKARGWSQDYLGRRLMGLTGRTWSRASLSAAESSWRGSRIRRFDANELLAFSTVFRLPVGYFFLPPDEPEWSRALFFADSPEGEVPITTLKRHTVVEAIENLENPPEYVERLQREIKSATGLSWSPGGFAVTLPMSEDQVDAFIEGMKAFARAQRGNES